VVAKDGINLQRTITMGKPLISGSVTRPFYEFGGTKLVQNFQTICKLLIYMLKNGGQGRNRSALHAFRNSSKRHFVESKIRSNHLSCKMLGIHGASWHFLTLLRWCLPRQLEYRHFPGVSGEYLHTVNHKPCTGIGEGFARRVREARRCASRKNFGI
jgi:hypothetical protein